MRIVIVVVALVGLYLAVWHSGVPLSHFEVFGGRNNPFASQHTIHAVVGVILLGAAEWLRLRYWNRSTATGAATGGQRVAT